MKSEYAATNRPTSGPVTFEIRKLRRAPFPLKMANDLGNVAVSLARSRAERLRTILDHRVAPLVALSRGSDAAMLKNQYGKRSGGHW